MEHGWIEAGSAGVICRVQTADGRRVRASITFESAWVVRYRLEPEEGEARAKFGLTRDHGWLAPAVRVEAEAAQAVVTADGGGLAVRVEREPWRVTLLAGGRVITRERPDDMDARGIRQSEPTGFWREPTGRERVRANFELFSDEHLYGFGEKFTDLDKRGQNIRLWNRNPYGSGRELAYKNIPLFVSTRGYGVFVNTTVPTQYDLGTQSNFAYGIEAEEEELDLYLIYGPGFPAIFRRYQELTGLPALPPKWAFGLWLSPLGEVIAGEDMGQEGIVRLAETVRAQDIAADVIHLDPYWMRYGSLCDFEWSSRFPAPAEMMRALGERGFRVCLWEHPYVNVESEMFQEGDAKGYFLKRDDGSTYIANLVIAPEGSKKEYKETGYDPGGIVDFSNPEATEWYKGKHRPLLEAGAAVFKTDFGEEIPEDSHWHNGMTGHEMHNAYPLLYNQAVFDVTGEYTERPFVWGRSAYAGIQAYPVQWSGDPLADFPSLSATLRGGLSYAMSGVPFWSHDLGGFRGQPSEAVYVRWIQFGLFTPFARLHGTTTRMPWRYGRRALEIFRRYDHLRYRLLPYIYSTAKACVEQGIPFMRPMALAFPDDPATVGLDQQYLFGESLLAAPVFNEEGRVDVYLPEGTWFDFWTRERVQGPRFLRRTAPLEEMPLYVRGDSILPYAPLRQWVEEGAWNPLTLQLWLEGHARLVLRDDDGETEYEATKTADGVSVMLGEKRTASGESVTYDIELRAGAKPLRVTFNGRPVSPAAPGDDEGYWLEGETVTVRCRGGGRLEVRGA